MQSICVTIQKHITDHPLCDSPTNICDWFFLCSRAHCVHYSTHRVNYKITQSTNFRRPPRWQKPRYNENGFVIVEKFQEKFQDTSGENLMKANKRNRYQELVFLCNWGIIMQAILKLIIYKITQIREYSTTSMIIDPHDKENDLAIIGKNQIQPAN